MGLKSATVHVTMQMARYNYQPYSYTRPIDYKVSINKITRSIMLCVCDVISLIYGIKT
jgi:hypothetical protein